jgi:RyR domain
MLLLFEKIASICHETNRAYCATIGDHSQKPWKSAKEWQRESALRGVVFALKNPKSSVSAQHDAWVRDKAADGWKFGPLKDAEKKEHPCMVAYDQLPREQRVKDYLFRGVVNAFGGCRCFLNSQRCSRRRVKKIPSMSMRTRSSPGTRSKRTIALARWCSSMTGFPI